MNNPIFRLTQRSILLISILSGLTACSSINSFMGKDKIDYQSTSKSPIDSLEVPPDLTQIPKDNRYIIPENKGTATASSYQTQNSTNTTITTPVIAPQTLSDVRIEKSGNQRWIVAKQSPEVLWPQIKQFWQNSGFVINIDIANSGIMETDWAENRAKIQNDIIRNTLGKVFDSLYSTGERDKFRTRLERTSDGNTEIYVSHRGVQEVITGTNKESTIWTPRPSDHELEAEFLARLMNHLGVEKDKAHAMLVTTNAQTQQATLMSATSGQTAHLKLNDGFERAWRRVGLALDQIGFTVEDRDRTKGVYYVRYLNPDADAKNSSTGFFSKLFSSNKDDDKKAQRYQIIVKGQDASSQIFVLDTQGKPDTSAVSGKILSLLQEQLK